MKRLFFLVSIALFGCGQDPSAQVVKAFVKDLESGAVEDAWELLTPGTHAVYDSTVAVLQRFGFEESRVALDSLFGGLTPEEFAALDGKGLFVRMTGANDQCRNLSGTVRSVRHISDSLCVVVLSTALGTQEVGVELCGGRWLVDLTTLTPPTGQER